MQIHNNATTTPFLRNMIQTKAGSNVIGFCRKYGISKTTYYRWKDRTQTEDMTSKPHKIKYKLTKEDEQFILKIRKETKASAKYINEILRSRNINVSLSTLYRLFSRYGINKTERKINKFYNDDLGFVHVDVTYLPKYENKKYYLFVAIDRKTRLVYYDVYPEKSADNTILFMNDVERKFSFKIIKLLTDNGKEFSNAKRISKLDLWCDGRDIEHRLTKPYTPKTNGMVERFNGIVKRECIKIEHFATIKMLKNALKNYLKYYNEIRVHGSLSKEYKEIKNPTPKIVCDYLLAGGKN